MAFCCVRAIAAVCPSAEQVRGGPSAHGSGGLCHCAQLATARAALALWCWRLITDALIDRHHLAADCACLAQSTSHLGLKAVAPRHALYKCSLARLRCTLPEDSCAVGSAARPSLAGWTPEAMAAVGQWFCAPYFPRAEPRAEPCTASGDQPSFVAFGFLLRLEKLSERTILPTIPPLEDRSPGSTAIALGGVTAPPLPIERTCACVWLFVPCRVACVRGVAVPRSFSPAVPVPVPPAPARIPVPGPTPKPVCPWPCARVHVCPCARAWACDDGFQC